MSPRGLALLVAVCVAVSCARNDSYSEKQNLRDFSENQRLSDGFECAKPRKMALRSADLVGEEYSSYDVKPQWTVVDRCGNNSGCCNNSRCDVARGKKESRTYYLVQGNNRIYIRKNIFVHKTCSCSRSKRKWARRMANL